ncbi:hypothetical protein VFPPC_17993 [Pochonia chlamydosporia 170]|uniref:Uncharacterized protein n=1 Tax=Pochonia chlamydosporia 170 TaxID=1380566 RepID=A0A219AR76_METCM|nr:hypothetical protein VFPPC_17993 [Pochonia chlamydosporia 170]OWT42814.1 hypothetical protein VFPPC_17993 [Pochonia chlamydosporia 170]
MIAEPPIGFLGEPNANPLRSSFASNSPDVQAATPDTPSLGENTTVKFPVNNSSGSHQWEDTEHTSSRGRTGIADLPKNRSGDFIESNSEETIHLDSTSRGRSSATNSGVTSISHDMTPDGITSEDFISDADAVGNLACHNTGYAAAEFAISSTNHDSTSIKLRHDPKDPEPDYQKVPIAEHSRTVCAQEEQLLKLPTTLAIAQTTVPARTGNWQSFSRNTTTDLPHPIGQLLPMIPPPSPQANSFGHPFSPARPATPMDFSKIVISQKDQPGPSELTKDIHGKTIGNKAKTSGRQSRQFLHDTQSSSGTVGSGETDATEVQDGSTNSGISHGLHLLMSEEMRTLTSDSLNNEPL